MNSYRSASLFLFSQLHTSFVPTNIIEYHRDATPVSLKNSELLWFDLVVFCITIPVFSLANFLSSYKYSHYLLQGCTVQAKTFNEEVKDIRKTFGAELVGISGQDVESKQKFAKDLGLDFSILADEGDAVRKAFKVPKAAFGLLPGRVTYVLDKNGVCTKVYDDLANAASHVAVAKEALANMKPAASSKKGGNPLASLFAR